MKLISERETETAIYRVYEDGVGRMESITLKTTAHVPAASLVEIPRLLPGSAAAGAAYRAGTEDEYIDGMSCRYGGDW